MRAALCLAFAVACSPQQGAKAVNAGVSIGLCILEHSSEPPEKVAVLCGAQNVDQVVGIWAAARRANVRGFARLPPDAGP